MNKDYDMHDQSSAWNGGSYVGRFAAVEQKLR
jgi:hypothetical protein